MLIQDPTDKIHALEEVLRVLIGTLPASSQTAVRGFLEGKIRDHADQIQEIPPFQIRVLGPNETSPVILNRNHQRQIALYSDIRDSIFPRNNSRA